MEEVAIPEHISAPDSPASVPDKDKNGEEMDWPKDDDIELFNRIRQALPKDDVMKYDSRVNHLDWDAICFKEYSADDCKNRWLHVQGRIRRFRIIRELIDDAITWRSRPWTNFNKGSKSQKHPEYPKKPLTSYMLFYMEKKDEVLENQPGLGMTDLSKVIAKLYNEMSERKKEKYTEQAKIEKEQYELKVRKFMEDHPDYVPLKSEKLQQLKRQPPKAPTPFKLYLDAKLPKLIAEGLSAADAKEKCKEKYKALSDKQRLKWIYKAVEQELVYNSEFEKFKSEHPTVETGPKKSILSKDEKQLKEKMEGKPEKPPNSGYSLYSKELLASQLIKHVETKDRMSEISRQWKALTEEERHQYNDRAQEMIHQYKLEYATYLESLAPEQREAEMRNSVQKTTKRPANASTDAPKAKKTKKVQKSKIEVAAPVAAPAHSSSDEEEEEDDEDEEEEEEEDSDVEAKPVIQKPVSSLQMFCDQNLPKYKKQHPKMSQQELNRLMAKEFSNLTEKKKKVYAAMAEKAKSELVKSPVAKTKAAAKSKGAAAASASKTTPAKTAAASALSKASAAKTLPAAKIAKVVNEVLKSPKAVPKAKATPERPAKAPAAAAAAASPVKAATKPSLLSPKQVLYKNEPPKPPESAAIFYGMTVLKDSALSKEEVEERWAKLSEKQQKKYSAMHMKKQTEYAVEFENFVRVSSFSNVLCPC